MSMPALQRVLAIVLCSCALPAWSGDPDARAWLERMTKALATRSYEGKFFHLSASRSESMWIIHSVKDGKVTERLVALDNSGREIIRSESELICYLPDQRTVLVEKRDDQQSLLSSLPSYSEQLETHYSIETGPMTKVHGRKTQLILVQPRDQYRYGYRLWLDKETAMPLKSQLCDARGNVIEQMLFAELRLQNSIPAERLKPGVDASGFKWIKQDIRSPRTPAAQIGWSVVRLPAGFKLRTARLQRVEGVAEPTRHLVFSDGLASVSVFIEPRRDSGQSTPSQGLAKLGSAFAYSRPMNGHQVTAVGEVPAATVEAIAINVSRQPDGNAADETATGEATR
jgi:sigma-E factor negative regulatory protein RseB